MSLLKLFSKERHAIENKDDMTKFLVYELSPYPLKIFDASGMRKTEKSAFYLNFEPVFVFLTKL